ncbi:uncharacterized protein ACR2FA_012234 [Aphomia sociella]
MDWFNIMVVMLVLCVLECSTMSENEIEEFTNYLRKTSQLDQILKKGADSDEDDYDEDEPASDHAWEESGKFEGDLILNERQRRLIVENVAEGLSRNGLRDSTKRWPNNEVTFYIQKEHFSSDQVDAIQNGIDDIAQASCIKFRPYKKGDRDAVVIQGSRRGCFSQVGYQGGYQVLNLSGRHPVGRGCFRHGTVVHELLHTLGFYHMQSSPDRDDYVDVVWENIVQPARHNFRKYNTFAVSDFGVGYDYDSVLHYSRRAFSANGQDTIVPKKSGADIGQRVGLSDKDTQKLNKMYCDANSNSFDAEPQYETSKKPVTNKKTPKNKPFEGHGIGYHQGKTVVIKLLPAAETYRLPDIPEIHLFDYFSKTPQAVSTSQIEGPGKQLEYSTYKSPASIIGEDYDSYDSDSKSTLEDHINGNKGKENFDLTPSSDIENATQDSKLGVDIENNSQVSFKVDNQTKYEEISTEVQNNEDTSSDKLDHDLNDAFERLGRIIKTHVYPSQTPDLNIYKINTNYKEFYTPQRSSPQISDKVQYVEGTNYSLLPPEERTQENHYLKGDGKSTPLFLENLNSSPKTYALVEEQDVKEPGVLQQNQQGSSDSSADDADQTNLKEMDSSYRTSFPLKYEYYILEKQNTPQYESLAKLRNKHNYSSLYSPINEPIQKGTKAQYKILGQLVPIYNEWYTKDEYKHNPVNYNINIYNDDIHEKTSKQIIPDQTQKYIENDSSPKAYLLFGVPVPLSRNWTSVPTRVRGPTSRTKHVLTLRDRTLLSDPGVHYPFKELHGVRHDLHHEDPSPSRLR